GPGIAFGSPESTLQLDVDSRRADGAAWPPRGDGEVDAVVVGFGARLDAEARRGGHRMDEGAAERLLLVGDVHLGHQGDPSTAMLGRVGVEPAGARSSTSSSAAGTRS